MKPTEKNTNTKSRSKKREETEIKGEQEGGFSQEKKGIVETRCNRHNLEPLRPFGAACQEAAKTKGFVKRFHSRFPFLPMSRSHISNSGIFHSYLALIFLVHCALIYQT